LFEKREEKGFGELDTKDRDVQEGCQKWRRIRKEISMSTQRKRLMECMWSYENVSKIACVLGEIDFWIQELQVVMLAFVH